MIDMRGMMAAFPTGVAVIAAVGDDGRPWGMTCTSVCSVTLTPPTLLACLRSGGPTLRAVLERRGFALNFLQEDARATAESFASGAPDRFDRVRWAMSATAEGPHLETAAHTTADCRVLRTDEIGDHTVVYGEVVQITQHDEARPLLYGLRRFARWPNAALISR
jgi:flavin reductase (DIM6/NTAB) family NADH-FMN oxidoreductase RutF